MDDLHRAALKGDTNACRDLILKGVQIDAKETKDLWTPLRCAVSNGHEETCILLVNAGANLDIADKHGWTPLAHAEFKDNHEGVKNDKHPLAYILRTVRARKAALDCLK